MNRDVKMDVQLDVPMEGYAGRMEIVAGPTGRHRRPDAEKGRIAAESLAPGGCRGRYCSALRGHALADI